MKTKTIANRCYRPVLWALLLFLPISSMVYGQDITIYGATNVSKNAIEMYDASEIYDYTSGVDSYSWYFTNGQGQILSSDESSAEIEWDHVGSHVLEYEAWDWSDYYWGSINVTVTNATPSTPSVPTIQSASCGITVLARGTPPSGITWYWQTNSSGTSTSNSSGSITKTSSGIQYLRARDNSSGVWSASSSSKSYTVDIKPATPDQPSVANNCGNTVLTMGTLPLGVTWYWQSSEYGTSTGNSASSITRTSGTVYYLRARHNTSLCWSNPITVNYSINSVPGTPSAPSVDNNCGNTVLTRGTPPSDVVWYWQSSASGTSTSNSSTSVTRTSGTVYYLRGRHSNGCWGSARTINYTVNTVPGIPSAPSVDNNCGNTVLTMGTPPSNVVWYWQSSASGTSTSDSSTSVTRTSGTVYYLRGRHSNGCWGSAQTVNYNIDSVPGTPSEPSVDNNCGSTLLTMGTPPSGVTWYWQSSTSGTSTSDSSSSVTRTSGTVYYLRGRNDSSDCWGSIRTINYTVDVSSMWYADTDGDGKGDPSSSTSNCGQPSGYLSNNSDHDDTTVMITDIAPQTWYIDSDGDGYGYGATTLYASFKPHGYADNATDQCPDEAGTTNGCDYVTPTLSNENYIHTLTYQSAMSSPSGITENSDVLQSVDYFDGLGRPMQQVGIRTSGTTTAALNPNTPVEWIMDWTTGTGSTGFFNGNGTDAENERVLGPDPFGNTALIWRCGNDPASDPDGGWNTDYFNVDKTKTYRYRVWVKREGSHDGSTYHGTQNVDNLGGGANSNPYFWNGDLPQLGEWYLLVGIVHPHTHGGTDTGISGVYDMQGNKVIDGTEYRWRSDTTTARFRSYFYYSTDVNTRQYFQGPALEVMDGDEIPLEDMFKTGKAGDIVTHVAYDAYGRQVKEWLPYRAASGDIGSLRVTAETDANSYYTTHYPEDILAGTPNPFSEKTFEPSPLNRVTAQAAPGHAWRSGGGHEIGFIYTYNAANEVRHYKVTTTFADNTYTPILVPNGYYTPNELYRNVTRDENHASTGSATDKLHTTEEFTDKQGRVVLKRTYALVGSASVAEPHDTYYVYDDYGNLTYVIPPKVNTTDGISATELSELCYQYVYDQRNRLVEKKIPGKGKEYIVYNKLDQPIMTQDANQRENGEWLFTKYDAFGRVAYTGIAVEEDAPGMATSRIDVRAEADMESDQYESRSGANTYVGTTVYYSKTAYPTSFDQVLTVNYYDNYSFDLANEPTPPAMVFGTAMDDRTQGLATGTKVRVLGTDDWITTVTRYDDKARPIYTYSENEYLETVDIVESQLDFVGRPLKVRSSHTRSLSGAEGTIVTLDNFTYDHTGRLLTQTQCIGDTGLVDNCSQSGGNGGVLAHLPLSGDQTGDHMATASITFTNGTLTAPARLYIDSNATGGSGSGNAPNEELIVFNEYDNLGQLAHKTVGGGLQTVDYVYNVRGWLTSINNGAATGGDLWGMEIAYNDPTNFGGDENPASLFNGNISQTLWKTASDNTGGSTVSERYSFGYDALNRIVSAHDNTGNYDVGNITYDKMGNIQSLTRNGWQDNNGTIEFPDMDVLDYDYDSGNKLLKVTDTGNNDYGFKDGTNTNDDFGYDLNGNLELDRNKGITDIEYNHLNLPTKVNFDNGGVIDYVYDATGMKLKKEASTGTVTEYAGNYVYEGNPTSTTLQFFSHPEGYVNANGGGYEYVYQYSDHLGNVRLSYTENPDPNTTTPVIIEDNNYYPFGMLHKGYNMNGDNSLGNDAAQRWKFGGKEYQEELDLNWYDITARNYNPALGRWMNIDPLSEEMRKHSTYNYAFDNPIYFLDADGMSPSSSTENCPDCETEEDWNNYHAQIDNMAALMGYGSAEEMAMNFDHLDVFVDENGHRTLTNSGKAINISNHENRISALGEFFMPLIEGAPRVIANLFKGKTSAQTVKATDEVVDLGERAKEIHSTLSEVTQTKTTTAVVEVANEGGDISFVVASSEKRLRPAQRAALKSNETPATGAGHAEVTAMNAAKESGLKILRVGASRPICTGCERAIIANDAIPASPLKRLIRKNPLAKPIVK